MIRSSDKISVLYIHPIGVLGGAGRSMLEMITNFPEDEVDPHVIVARGPFASFLEKLRIPAITSVGITKFDDTILGHYRGFRWLILLRELYFFPFTLFAIIKAHRKWPQIDVIHINEITCIIPMILSKWIFKKPVIMHVRILERNDKKHFRVRLITRLLRNYADKIICIDQNVKASLPEGLSAEVVHNGFTFESKVKSINDEDNNQLTFLDKGKFKVGMIGVLLKYKGVFEFIEAAKICKEKGLNVSFILVGENPRQQGSIKNKIFKLLKFNHDVRAEIQQKIKEYCLEEYVHLLGFTSNIKHVYDQLDVVCFPSHLNAVGRPVFEAAFSRVPSIVAIKDPMADTIIDRETGICIEEKNPQAIADAIQYFYLNPSEKERMGEAAYKLALSNFDISNNAKKVLAIYKSLVK